MDPDQLACQKPADLDQNCLIEHKSKFSKRVNLWSFAFPWASIKFDYFHSLALCIIFS